MPGPATSRAHKEEKQSKKPVKKGESNYDKPKSPSKKKPKQKKKY